ncbi:transporter, partial [Bacillus cereus]|nr:transporter [Bacillus cereus]
MKKKMMTVFTIGVMSLSILGGDSPSETSKGKKDNTQRSKEQLN